MYFEWIFAKGLRAYRGESTEVIGKNKLEDELVLYLKEEEDVENSLLCAVACNFENHQICWFSEIRWYF